MDKEAVVRVYNGILLSHKRDAFESALMRWINLEPVENRLMDTTELGGRGGWNVWRE